ncbi:1-deoxy-D-xylulose-5-phosphate synthase [Culicoidibacter larvae]|uniref:1-deoxy-D-xylulose-5-phosphate synthase n=1 Tax=Culicoidibacter larvae TaxID=2579976 RepID=A0A5R8QCI8_9FIRM|nr:1-deoxy-D-xylulose-5-phosphate synthase [Culicoidibacter larvae]TLG74218.1 1-deoxy-D-xylulose-5-phosphate synthase [Culicoidibacter larvae]
MSEFNNLYAIQSPKFLKVLSVNELDHLAGEIRRFLVDSLSKTGGHIAPNLGVVELTIAMHYAFDSPTDKFLWDVGHQSYIHKILTGRAKDFVNLRKYKGLSGFPRREESEHDVWETGHASTSLSAALGMAVTRDAMGADYHIVPVIGDGALSGGMALEALNHIGYEQRRMIIILNDNDMSISNNVGAIKKHLERMRMTRSYHNVKQRTKSVVKQVPMIGSRVENWISQLKANTRKLFFDGKASFFEDLGLGYIGPINGHDISLLIEVFEVAKELDHPVVLHVSTEKGRGYNPAAADNRGSWHGIGPFDIINGKKIRAPKHEDDRAWSGIVSQTLERLAARDEKIIAVTPAMIKGSKLEFFQDKFADRLFDVGIAEEHAATFAGAMSIDNFHPFLAIYSTFLQRSYDQILHDIARQNLHTVIGVDRCGFATGDGDTHHGIYDISFLRGIPNMTICMPKDDCEAQNMLYSAFYAYSGPIAMRYPRGYHRFKEVESFTIIPYASWEVVKEGNDGVILAFGPQLKRAITIAERLAAEHGTDYAVVNARFIKPMDEQLLHQLFEKYPQLVTIEEGARIGGFGSAVLEFANKYNYHNQIRIFAIEDTFIAQGDIENLYKEAKIDTEYIVRELSTQGDSYEGTD